MTEIGWMYFWFCLLLSEHLDTFEPERADSDVFACINTWFIARNHLCYQDRLI